MVSDARHQAVKKLHPADGVFDYHAGGGRFFYVLPSAGGLIVDVGYF